MLSGRCWPADVADGECLAVRDRREADRARSLGSGSRSAARGETVVQRALLEGIQDRANARAHGHAARYWARLAEIAGSGVDLQRLPSHEAFAATIRARHGRKTAFWLRVSPGR